MAVGGVMPRFVVIERPAGCSASKYLKINLRSEVYHKKVTSVVSVRRLVLVRPRKSYVGTMWQN